MSGINRSSDTFLPFLPKEKQSGGTKRLEFTLWR